MVTDMTIILGEEAEGLLAEIIMVHQVIEIPSIKTKIGRIGHGETKPVKVGDITIEKMISRAVWSWLGRLL